LTDSQGRKVDFKNAVIVLTSNIGLSVAEEKVELGFRKTGRDAASKEARYDRMKKRVLDEVRKVFKPEFINRLDEMVVFQSLDLEEITQIVDLMLAKVSKEVVSQERTLSATQAAKEKLATEGFDAQYGARPLRRAIQRLVEDPLAEEFIRGNCPEGSHIEIDYAEGAEVLHFNITRKEAPAAEAEPASAGA
jgi:ATP-dependent Clp protease ATP-binding subunit ClpC